MKVNDRYTLRCGHSGTIIWIGDDAIAVKGPVTGRCCRDCNPRGRKRRHPTIFLIPRQDPSLASEETVNDVK